MNDCIRLTREGEGVRETIDDDGLARWLAFHSSMRPGWALFVDGVCHHPGFFVPAEIHVFETQYMLRYTLPLSDEDRSSAIPMHLNYAVR